MHACENSLTMHGCLPCGLQSCFVSARLEAIRIEEEMRLVRREPSLKLQEGRLRFFC